MGPQSACLILRRIFSFQPNPIAPLRNKFPAGRSSAVNRKYLAFQLPWKFFQDTMEKDA